MFIGAARINRVVHLTVTFTAYNRTNDRSSGMSGALQTSQVSIGARTLGTAAVLARLSQCLDVETSLVAVRVNSAWYEAMIPAVYRDVTMHFDSPFLAPGSSSGSLVPAQSRSKWSNLRYCRTLRLYDHDHLACRACPTLFEGLSGLVHLELAGGGLSRQASLDTVLCTAQTCPIITACTSIRNVTLRSLRGFQAVLPAIPSIRRLTLIMRPCQLPPAPSTPSTSAHTVPVHALEDVMAPLVTATECTVVFWDERHVHRLDNFPIHKGDIDALPQWFGTDFIRATRPSKKGCGCDETPVFPVGMPASVRLQRLIFALGRWAQVKQVALGNWERTAGGFDLESGPIDSVHQALLDDFRSGKEQQNTDHESNADRADEDVQLILVDQERVASEYYTPDPEEKPYWDLRYRPSARVLQLRSEVKSNHPRRREILDLWSEQELVGMGKWGGSC